MKILLIAGARPNFMKIAPIARAIKDRSNHKIKYKLIHTGQHYDDEMSKAFFSDLSIPEPDYYLNSGSGTHGEQTARIITAFETVCMKEEPDIVVVVGDVNSTLACSIVAKKLQVKVAHVEAGLRSFDQSMPEEINRIVTDSISDYFFVTEDSGRYNLLKEGKSDHLIHFVGNVMIDNLLYQKEKLENKNNPSYKTASLKNDLGEYIFLTMHRPSNVDNKEILKGIIQALNLISTEIPILFPMHPRTKKMLKSFDVEISKNIHCLPPLDFTESLFLWKDAKAVFTDSGGLQEETTALGIPCFTLRDNTERPITIKKGTNQLVGNQKENILSAWKTFTHSSQKQGRVPEKWDGKTAERIIDILLNS